MVNNYYQKHKGRLQKKAHKKYQSHSEKEKNKRRNRPKKDIKI